MSSSNWQVNSFLNFAWFFIVVTLNSLVNFKLIHFLVWIRVPYKSLNLETFKWLGENLPNSSCHLPNYKSVFFEILHLSLFSWKITPLYYFSSTIICFGQKQLIIVYVFETFECSSQNLSNSLCQFWKDKPIPRQLFHHSSVSLYITPL